jgi:hypothetical protein
MPVPPVTKIIGAKIKHSGRGEVLFGAMTISVQTSILSPVFSNFVAVSGASRWRVLPGTEIISL